MTTTEPSCARCGLGIATRCRCGQPGSQTCPNCGEQPIAEANRALDHLRYAAVAVAAELAWAARRVHSMESHGGWMDHDIADAFRDDFTNARDAVWNAAKACTDVLDRYSDGTPVAATVAFDDDWDIQVDVIKPQGAQRR